MKDLSNTKELTRYVVETQLDQDLVYRIQQV